MRAFTLFLLLVVLTGCANTKRDRYTTPVVPLPNQYKLAAPAPAAMESRKGGGESKTKPEVLAEAQLAEWWRMLGSPELNALVDRALANNADLRIATLRIVQAKARADQASADQRPVVTAPYQAKIEGPEFGIGSLVPGETIDRTRRTYQLSLRADWRADLWGERSSATESAEMQLWRATFQRDDTRRLLIANTAATYIEYLSFNDRVRVARETEAVLRDMLESVRARMEAGDATITDLEQQRAAVYAVQATIPALELQRENAANSLAQLLGVTPTALSLTDSGLEALNFPGVLPGVPANLLRQRPDVRVVEARLLAADADIDVAYARLLPPLDLTAQAGAGGYVFSRLFQNHTHFWTLIANLAATIFDSGKRDNEVAFARAMHEELVETYVRVLYNAIREAEDAIASVQMNSRRQDAQQAAADAARRAWEYSIESYGAGAIDYLTLLDTERTYHRNLDEFHRIRMERHKGLVALFNALGGGIPRSAALADEGAPSAATGTVGSADAAAPAGKSYLPVPEDGQEYWLVEIAGLQDRAGIAHLWRDLNKRFPELMAGRSVVPRLLGRVSFEEQERAAWYRVLVAHFPTLDAAELFCGQLGAQLQRCRVVSSRTEAFQDLLTRTRPELKAPTLETTPDLADASQRTTPPRLSADDPGRETGAAPAQSMPTVIEHMPEIEKPQQPSTRPSLPPTSGSAAAVYDNRSRGFVLKADIPKSSDLRHCLGLDSNDAVSRCISQLP